MNRNFKFDIAYYRKQKVFVWTLSYIDPKTGQPTSLQFQMGTSQISEIVRRLRKLIDESKKAT